MAGIGLVILVITLFGTTFLDGLKKTVWTAVLRGLTRVAWMVILAPIYLLTLSEVKNIGIQLSYSLAMVLLTAMAISSFVTARKRYNVKKTTPRE